jgi:hypothetical protein
MPAFFGQAFTLSTTPTKLVDADEFDRRVHWRSPVANVAVGFSGAVGFVLESSKIGDFVLPANEELWAASFSGTPELDLLVTTIA